MKPPDDLKSPLEDHEKMSADDAYKQENFAESQWVLTIVRIAVIGANLVCLFLHTQVSKPPDQSPMVTRSPFCTSFHPEECLFPASHVSQPGASSRSSLAQLSFCTAPSSARNKVPSVELAASAVLALLALLFREVSLKAELVIIPFALCALGSVCDAMVARELCSSLWSATSEASTLTSKATSRPTPVSFNNSLVTNFLETRIVVLEISQATLSMWCFLSPKAGLFGWHCAAHVVSIVIMISRVLDCEVRSVFSQGLLSDSMLSFLFHFISYCIFSLFSMAILDRVNKTSRKSFDNRYVDVRFGKCFKPTHAFPIFSPLP